MTGPTSQYIATVKLNAMLADAGLIEEKLAEIGMEREAFHISFPDPSQASIRFWEPDRVEALRFLAKLSELQ